MQYCIEEVSDYVILLLLASAKKFCVLERMVQRGEWDYAITKPSDTIHGKTLGLVGCGNIARAVARKAKVFANTLAFRATARAILPQPTSPNVLP